jgi:hypothetical protein
MIRVIPAHIEGGRVVPDGPIPPPASVRGVSIVFDLGEDRSRSTREAASARLIGLLKDAGDPDRLREEYVGYLEEKYR